MLLPFSKALAEERGPDKRIVLNNMVRPDGQGGVNGNGMIRTACRADFLCSEKRQERRIVMENRIALLGIIVGLAFAPTLVIQIWKVICDLRKGR